LPVTLHNVLCKDVAVVLGQHGKRLNHLKIHQETFLLTLCRAFSRSGPFEQ
jgi:hypothetical protein